LLVDRGRVVLVVAVSPHVDAADESFGWVGSSAESGRGLMLTPGRPGRVVSAKRVRDPRKKSVSPHRGRGEADRF
jgi:hypothetical protein